MAIDDIERYLNSKRRSLGWLGFFWRVIVLWPLLWGGVLLAFGLYGIFIEDDQSWGDTARLTAVTYYVYWLDVIYGIIVLLMVVWICKYIYAKTHSQDANPPLPTGYEILLNEVLNPLCLKTGIPRKCLHVSYKNRDLTINPSVIDTSVIPLRLSVHLVLTVGFIKILVNDRSCAEAILAHELGHIKAKDQRLLLTTTASAKVMLYASIPLNVAIALVTMHSRIGSFTVHPYDIETLKTFFYWLAIANIVTLTLGYLVLRAFRHQSELLADTFACLYGNVSGVESYLVQQGEHNSKLSFFAAHPQIAVRRQNVEYCKMLRQKDRFQSVSTPEKSPITSSILILSSIAILLIALTFWIFAPNAAKEPILSPPTYISKPAQARQKLINRIGFPRQFDTTSKENSMLLRAIDFGDGVGVTKALGLGANPNFMDQAGNTVLSYAVESGSLEVVNILLQAGADANGRTLKGGTPITAAARLGHTDIVKLLLKFNADINIQNANGHTALINGAINGHMNIVAELIKDGANLKIKDNTGNTALVDAAQTSHPDIALVLQKAEESQ